MENKFLSFLFSATFVRLIFNRGRGMCYFKFIFLFFALPFGALSAQDDILMDLSQPADNGAIVLMQENALLDSLLVRQCEVNLAKGGVPGFRVQLYRGSDVSIARTEAAKVKAMVLEALPDATVDEEYVQPVWYIRMGKFVNYKDALKLRSDLEKLFPSMKNDIYVIPAIIPID